ncbi:MAG: penicillin acylase family protein, partial [Flavisolibacter sp.]
SLFRSYDGTEPADSLKKLLLPVMDILKSWDRNSGTASIATTLAIEWATRLMSLAPAPKTDRQATNSIAIFQWLATHVTPEKQLKMMRESLEDLQARFGTWRIAWGDINRYQRNAKSTNTQFDDQSWSLPVGLASGTWGSLPSFNSRRFANTNKRYGVSGNSFIAAVEFGKRIKARTIMTGGESFDPASKNFTDQAEGFLEGKFKEVYFYKEDVIRHAVRTYHPGE